MKKIEKGKVRYFRFIEPLIFISYTVAAFGLLKFSQYKINPDGIAYINVAFRYLKGDFWSALNGTWSPFISWFIAPLIKMGINPLLTIRISNIFFGLLLLFFISLILKEFTKNVWVISTLPLISGLIVLDFVLTGSLGADILSVLIFATYSYLLIKNYPWERKYGFFVVSIVAVLGFLAKGFFLPFFLVSFFLISIYKLASIGFSKKLLYRSLAAIFCFLVLISPWVTLLSMKYGRFTYSVAGTYNSAVLAPKYLKRPDYNITHPMYTEGFFAPPYDDATSVNDDLAWVKLDDWSFWQSRENLNHYFGILKKNLKDILNYTAFYYHLPFLLYVLSFGFLAYSFIKKKLDDTLPLLIINLLSLVYIGGYFLMYIETRYIWLVPISSVVILGYFFNFFKNKIYRSLIIVSSILLVISPFNNLLNLDKDQGKEFYLESQKLMGMELENKKVASNTNRIPTLFLCYYLKCNYYGIEKPEIDKETLEKELKDFDIGYFFYWTASATPKPSNYLSITKPFDGLEVYRFGGE